MLHLSLKTPAVEVNHLDDLTPERFETAEPLLLACGHTSWL